MPTIEISKADLENLLGRKIKEEELEDLFTFVKGELEEINGDMLKIDIKDTNRPDLWSVEGIARELKGHLRIETGMPKYNVEVSDISVNVDPSVKDIRPFVVCAVVENVELSDALIRELMQLQEKIHMTFGRRREYVAIGISDLDKISGKRITYKAVGFEEISFPPLGFEEKMTPKQILEEHPKGKEYGHLIKDKGKAPVLVDESQSVISMPPIINSNTIGKVTEKTRNLFIDVTGLKMEDVITALNVVVTALADRGGKIKSVVVDYGDKKIESPDLRPRKITVSGEKIRKILGLGISCSEIVRLLKEARYDAEIIDEEKEVIDAYYLPTRQDILHWRDVAEDVAISFGYNDFETDPVKVKCVGETDRFEDFSDKIREVLVGYSLQEVMTFTLTNKEVMFKKMNREEKDIVEIANPVSQNWTNIRCDIMPCLMEFLSKNTHVEYPQRIFEVGDVVIMEESQDVKTRTERRVCIMLAGNEEDFTKIKEIIESFAELLGLKFEYKEDNDPAFIPGRCAKIMVNNVKIGVLGEISPKVLENFEVKVPVSGAELNLTKIFELWEK